MDLRRDRLVRVNADFLYRLDYQYRELTIQRSRPDENENKILTDLHPFFESILFCPQTYFPDIAVQHIGNVNVCRS